MWQTPLDRSKIVLSRGIAKGSKGVIPCGGHDPPISTAGDKLAWKKAQNTLKKAKISLTINRATPKLSPFCTANVWLPRNDPSAATSLNHKIIANNVAKNPIVSSVPPLA